MQIKLTKAATVTVEAGSTVTVSDEQGRLLIQSGCATEAEKKVTKKKDTKEE